MLQRKREKQNRVAWEKNSVQKQSKVGVKSTEICNRRSLTFLVLDFKQYPDETDRIKSLLNDEKDGKLTMPKLKKKDCI